jgi:hypothetical protein
VITRRASRQGPPPRRLAVCIATARSGKRCKAAPVRGTKYCPLHSGDTAKVLGARGGRRRAIFDPDKLTHFAAPTSARDLATIMAQLMLEVHGARLDTKASNAIACLGQTFLQALNNGEIEDRLSKLEAAYSTTKDRQQRGGI